MENGWIKLNRQITEHWMWTAEPFSHGQAWIDLLLLANYEDKKMPYKGKIIICKRGDVNISFSALAQRWKWHRTTVRRFLDTLASDGMVTINATTKRTIVTIVNYDKFQCNGTTDATTDVTNDAQVMRQLAHITKKEKNIKNNNNVFTPPTLEEITAYCRERNNNVDPKQFFDYFQTGNWIDSEGKPVRNWKQKLITWEKKGRKPQPQKPKTNNIESHDYDFAELEKVLTVGGQK